MNLLAGEAWKPGHAAGSIEYVACDLAHVASPHAEPQHQRDELLVGQPFRSDTLEPLPGPVGADASRRHVSAALPRLVAALGMRPYTALMHRRRFTPSSCSIWFIALCVLTVACAEPPQKEISRAEGAIDAAKAAGAETYATEEFTNALRALERSRAAVDESDYRQALSHALDAFEQAELAAGTAATQKAKARGDLDARLSELSASLGDLEPKLEMAAAAKVPDARLKAPRTALASLERALQEARSDSDNGDLQKAGARLDALTQEIAELGASIDALVEASRPARRTR